MIETSDVAQAPAISVIISTWNRRDLLRKTLDSLANQTLPASRFETIVVDNGSTDGTSRMLEEMQARLPFRLICRRLEKNVGPGVARNEGTRLARSGIYALTDSDCQACPRWLELAVAAFQADPELGFLTGPTINAPGQRTRFFSVGGAGCKGEDPIYPAANVVYRARVFTDAGQFDPTTWICDAGPTPLSFEDVDLAWRVKERGYRNLFLEDLVVYHEVRHLTPWEWLRHYTRIMAIPEVVRRHPDFGKRFLWWGPFCLPENPLFYAAVAGALLAAFSPWLLLLVLPFLLRIAFLLTANCAQFRDRPAFASVVRLPLFLAQVGLLGMRQAVICGSLIYGSIRSRTLVL
jgi:glycosyltransferase involved in cell wall biosynthesis